MKIIYSNNIEDSQLPLKLNISFKKVIEVYKNYAIENNKFYHKSASKVVKELEKYPELEEGFSDFSLIEKYKEQIKLILKPLFPDLLSLNEIKAVSIPFDFTSFNLTQRFKDILENAGENYQLKIRDYQGIVLW